MIVRHVMPHAHCQAVPAPSKRQKVIHHACAATKTRLVRSHKQGLSFLVRLKLNTNDGISSEDSRGDWWRSCRLVVSSCLVLSCLVLSCLVLSCLVLSCLVLSCLVFLWLFCGCFVCTGHVWCWLPGVMHFVLYVSGDMSVLSFLCLCLWRCLLLFALKYVPRVCLSRTALAWIVAGFFAAIRCKTLTGKSARVILLEQSPRCLGKVKISGWPYRIDLSWNLDFS
jgi:hypothetical protein